MLVLLFVALWFILRGDLVLSIVLSYFVLVIYSPFSIAITSLREERANLNTVRTFFRFALVWFCQLPLPLGVWGGLRLVRFIQLVRFARATSNLSDLNGKALTAKLLRQGYRYFKLRKAFSTFYRRHSAWVEKYRKIINRHKRIGYSLNIMRQLYA